MLKKLLFGLAVGTVALVAVSYNKQKKSAILTDAKKFKADYESINDLKREKDGKIIRHISIPEENPMIYSNCEEIVSKIDAKDSFAVYFGFNECPWCRSCVETMIATAKELNLEKIYYVDVKEVRDILALNSNNELIIQKNGGSGYAELLSKLDSVLADYTLKDAEGNEVSTNEKRIYAPNVVIVKDGEPLIMIEGTSKLQKDANEELSVEMINDMKEIFTAAFGLLNNKESCGVRGC
ncbi:MAG: hypothetical protein MR210_02475 [Erysipelotrichaceae bacterium]|nr:hypothetical protein [Erysipelotrichaceae bacterium]MDY5252769.1 hypothetical protein [Erysipelotrichaceae bacterium]